MFVRRGIINMNNLRGGIASKHLAREKQTWHRSTAYNGASHTLYARKRHCAACGENLVPLSRIY